MNTEQQHEYIIKREKLFELYQKINSPFIISHFDIDSDELLDQKIEILQRVVDGQNIQDIENYLEILEKYPKQSENRKVFWDL